MYRRSTHPVPIRPDRKELQKNRPPKGGRFAVERYELQLVDVGRLGALLALTNLEADALILVQGTETRGFDGGVVHEEIGASVIGGDESETLFGVEPLNGALSHDDYLLFFVLDTDALSLPGEVAMLFSARTIGGQFTV